MATKADVLEALLLRAAPLRDPGAGSVTAQLERLSAQVAQLRTVQQAALDAARGGPQTTTASFARSEGGGESGRSAKGTVLQWLPASFALSPLLSGLLRLFGGGGADKEPPPLVRFALPAARNVMAGISAEVGHAFEVDYGQGGVPRPVMAPQVTVQVQAMDSRSFLDHRQDIALAVRQAMLESGVLNDVVREV
jgi:hypothetical protein